MLCSLIISFSSPAQDISYDDLSSIDWGDYPYSLVELLLEHDFEFIDKNLVDEILGLEDRARESYYQLTYAYLEDLDLQSAAYVVVDEMNAESLPATMPVLKLRFWYQKKSEYIRLSDEIKSACGEPNHDFYIGDNSTAFIIDRELLDGEPNYYILFYHMTMEEFEEIKKLSDQILEMFKDE